MDWATFAMWAAGVAVSLFGAYHLAQIAIRTTIVRLEERYAALERRVTAVEGYDLSAIRSQVADARAEIVELREKKHDIGSLKSQVSMIVNLLARYTRLEKEV